MLEHLETDCTCFICSLNAVIRTPDEIDKKQLEACISGLKIALLNQLPKGPPDESDPVFLNGLLYGIQLALHSMNVPAYITQKPELVSSMVVHTMQCISTETLKNLPELMKRMNAANSNGKL